MQAEELKGLPNLVPVTYTDGPYHNFPDTQKICDGVWFVKAKGHTNGNSLVIAESDGLYYMFEADITYVDEALYENKLSVVYDDLPAAREYDPAEHDGVAFEDLPDDWRCPRCKQPKEKFNKA